MATVKAIKYGMKGDDVANLQTTLKNLGYNIDVDGSFGPQTLAAVKSYQQANGLDVDGMVGPQTKDALFKVAAPASNSASTLQDTSPSPAVLPSQPVATPKQDTSPANPGASAAASEATPAVVPASGVKNENNANIYYPEDFSYEDFSYGDYAESETVLQAQAALNAVLAAQPGAYQSQWQSQINDIIDRILNREEFSYDVNEDALYQQYKDQYIQGGKLAMQDTMGQAAAMTGGYGNSYAATVGNQAYQNYLSKLNEVVPELYGMALDRYNMEGEEMYNQYGLLSAQEAQDYGRWQDSYNQWLAERDYATGRYDSERDYDYGKYIDDRNYEYGVYSDDRNQAYNEYLAAVQQAQFDAQYAEEIRQYNENMAFNKEQADISNSQWEQSFAEQQKQNAIGNQQWQQSFDENVKQNAISNAQWETSRQDTLDSENRAYAREEVLAVIANGGTPNAQQLKVAGLTKKTAEAMVAVSSAGNSSSTADLVSKLSTKEIVDMLDSYANEGNGRAVETVLDDLYLTGRIDYETMIEWDEKYNPTKNKHVITNTTVPVGSNNYVK